MGQVVFWPLVGITPGVSVFTGVSVLIRLIYFVIKMSLVPNSGGVHSQNERKAIVD